MVTVGYIELPWPLSEERLAVPRSVIKQYGRCKLIVPSRKPYLMAQGPVNVGTYGDLCSQGSVSYGSGHWP
jgi:hypothetical protein